MTNYITPIVDRNPICESLESRHLLSGYTPLAASAALFNNLAADIARTEKVFSTSPVAQEVTRLLTPLYRFASEAKSGIASIKSGASATLAVHLPGGKNATIQKQVLIDGDKDLALGLAKNKIDLTQVTLDEVFAHRRCNRRDPASR